MKILLFSLMSITFLLSSHVLYGDVIILNSGREIEGKIEEETEDHIKINIGVGSVGFAKDRIKEIRRTDDENIDQLEEKLEQKRQQALQDAQENEKEYERSQQREELIEQQQERQETLRQQREEMLQKRREQLERLRKEREQAISERAQNHSGSTMPVPGQSHMPSEDSLPPPPPELMGIDSDQPMPHDQPMPDIPQIEPPMPEPTVPEFVPEAEETQTEGDDSSGFGRHRRSLRDR